MTKQGNWLRGGSKVRWAGGLWAGSHANTCTPLVVAPAAPLQFTDTASDRCRQFSSRFSGDICAGDDFRSK